MKPNRIHGNGGKKVTSAQSAKSTTTPAEKPLVSPAVSPDKSTIELVAVLNILQNNETQFALSEATIHNCVPRFGVDVSPERLKQILDALKRIGVAFDLKDGWKAAPLNCEESDKKRQSAFDELENSINQTRALNQLFMHWLLFPEEGGAFTDSVQAGLTELHISSYRRLDSAHLELRKAKK